MTAERATAFASDAKLPARGAVDCIFKATEAASGLSGAACESRPLSVMYAVLSETAGAFADGRVAGGFAALKKMLAAGEICRADDSDVRASCREIR